MSGILAEVVPRTKYTFDSIPASTTFNILIARYVDISQYLALVLVVRVHARTLAAAGATIRFDAIPELPSPQDPAQDFTNTALGQGISITSGTTSPSEQLVGLPANFGSSISILMTVTQGSAASALNVTVSIALSEKSGDS
jgi:hypothetical protein